MNTKKRHEIEKTAEMVRKSYEIGIPFSQSINKTLEKLGGKLEIIQPSVWESSELCLRTKMYESNFTIKVRPYTYIDEEGRVYYERRKCFEIARQLGHLFMHTTYLETLENNEKALLFTEDVLNSALGIEANQFAYNLIMPRAEFIKEVRKNIEGDYVKMKKVVEKFDVNYEMAIYRAKTLKLIEWTIYR